MFVSARASQPAMAMLTAYGGRMSQGILNPVAPQGVVVGNAVVQPNLIQSRQQEPSPRFPLHNCPTDLTVRRGEWAFMLSGRAGRFVTPFRPNMDDLPIFTSANGLAADVDGPGEIVFVGHVDTPDELNAASGDGSAAPELGCVVRRAGTCSGINRGSAHIQMGSKVYWDWPEMLPGSEAHPLPRFGTKGERTKFHFATKTLQPGSAFTYVMAVSNELLNGIENATSEWHTKPLSETLRLLHEKHSPLQYITMRHSMVLRLARAIEKAALGFTLKDVADAGGSWPDRIVALQTWAASGAKNADALRTLIHAVVEPGESDPEKALEAIVPGATALLLGNISHIADPKAMWNTVMRSLCFIPHWVQSTQIMIDSRYMGVALGPAPSNGQLDLLLG